MVDVRSELWEEACTFSVKLAGVKAALAPPSEWYAYDILGIVAVWDMLLAGTPYERFVQDLHGAAVADIGAADGDLSFFLESRGNSVDIVDCSKVRRQGLQPATMLKAELGSAATIHDVDLDEKFELPRDRYDLAVFNGILYHLKNPFYALEAIARKTQYCFMSTRVARYSRTGAYIKDDSAAYLLDAWEANQDDTNYWIFSETGLRTLIRRTRWEPLAFMTMGDTRYSNPVDNEHDERAYCFMRSLV